MFSDIRRIQRGRSSEASSPRSSSGASVRRLHLDGHWINTARQPIPAGGDIEFTNHIWTYFQKLFTGDEDRNGGFRKKQGH